MLPFYACIGLIFAVPVMQRQALASQADKQAQVAEARLASSREKGRTPLLNGKPARIVIPRLGIDLGVVPGAYMASQASWTVSGSQANYALNSAELNNRADKTLIYGHANSKVFSQTINLEQGDTVYAFTDNGHVFEYRYVSKTVVKPSQVEVLDSLNGKPGLVLMSCEGAWYQDRRLMYFDLVRAT